MMNDRSRSDRSARKFFDWVWCSLTQGEGSTLFLWLIGAWLLAMILTPIGLWIWGETAFPLLTWIAVLLQMLAGLAAVTARRPWRWIAGRLALILVVSTAVEYMGTKTGLPFGRYEYTDLIAPRLAGVPLVIPFAWTMMLFPAWGIASAISSGSANRNGAHLGYALVAALAFTAWDLYLDPQMAARGVWVWERPGGYFGIPWSNYAGWLISAALITLLAKPGPLADPKLVLIYSLTWLFQGVAQFFFWGQPGPALVGFLFMGIFSVAAWRSLWLNSKQCSGS